MPTAEAILHQWSDKYNREIMTVATKAYQVVWSNLFELLDQFSISASQGKAQS